MWAPATQERETDMPEDDVRDVPPSEPYRPDRMGRCPHAANAAMLARGPVVRMTLPGDVPAMAVLGHEALKEFLVHPDVAKNARHFTDLREGRIPRGWPMKTFATVPGMTTADGADHRRLRSLVSQAFTARRVEALRPRIESLAAELLDGLEGAASAAGGVADLRRYFALPLPMGVVAELLGADEEYRGRLHELANNLVDTTLAPEEVLAANQEMTAMLGAVVASRRQRPGDDLVTALIAAHDEDEGRLSEPELIGTLLLMIVAGHETTLNLIDNAVRALTTHPDQLGLLLRGEAAWADVVEETLRWDTPVNLFPFRYPTRDLTLAGTLIPAGTPVLAGYGAAGRDTSAHGPDAGRFDITRRAANRHISLGHGAHYCVGAPLARLEASIALERLFTRFPGLTLAVADEDLPHNSGFIGNGVQRLPVRPHGPDGGTVR
jgi:2-hydroxy-5-methyl-1-naphthoate 7-hydroxylase